jgi:2TM domain
MKDRGASNDDLRTAAIKRIKKKTDLKAHLFVYVVVNAFLVAIWAITGAGFFWPIFPILGWGFGVVFNVWDVYRREAPTEEQVQREIHRLRGRPAPITDQIGREDRAG